MGDPLPTPDKKAPEVPQTPTEALDPQAQAVIDEQVAQEKEIVIADKKEARDALAEQINTEGMADLTTRLDGRFEPGHWDDEGVRAYALQSVRNIFAQLPAEVPGEDSTTVKRIKKEWINLFIDQYIFQLSEKKTAGIDLDDQDVRAARDSALLELGNFEKWVTKAHPELGKAIAEKKAQETAMENAAKARENEDKKFQKENSDTIQTLLARIEKISVAVKPLRSMSEAVAELKTKVSAAKSARDLETLDTEISQYESPELAAELSKVSTGLDVIRARYKAIGEALNAPDFGVTETDNLLHMIDTLRNPAALSSVMPAFDALDARIVSAENIVKMIEDSPIEMSAESLAEISQELSKGDGSVESLTALEKKVSQSIAGANAQIEEAVKASETGIIDRANSFVSTMKDGSLKSIVSAMIGMMHSIGGMLTGMPIIGDWAKHNFFTADERLAGGDQSIVLERNTKRHILRTGLPVEFAKLFAKYKVSEVINACTKPDLRKKLDENDAYKNELDWFNAQVTELSNKVSGSKDKPLIELLGDPKVKFKYRPVGGFAQKKAEPVLAAAPAATPPASPSVAPTPAAAPTSEPAKEAPAPTPTAAPAPAQNAAPAQNPAPAPTPAPNPSSAPNPQPAQPETPPKVS